MICIIHSEASSVINSYRGKLSIIKDLSSQKFTCVIRLKLDGLDFDSIQYFNNSVGV